MNKISPRIPKPTIPKRELEKFLQDKLLLSDVSKIKNIDEVFLWSGGGYERYRVNVWVVQTENEALGKQHIGKSFFIHYNRIDNVILDKTEGDFNTVNNGSKIKF